MKGTLAWHLAQRAARMAGRSGPYDLPAQQHVVTLFPDREELHRQVALPGAKRAVTVPELRRMQRAGLTPVQVVAKINERWEHENPGRAHRMEQWRGHYYQRVQEHLAKAREG